MSDTVWIKHPATGGVSEVPKDALPIYRQSGWQELPKAEQEALEKRQADEQAAAEEHINKLAQQALGNEPVSAPPVEASEPEKTTKSSSKKENG